MLQLYFLNSEFIVEEKVYFSESQITKLVEVVNKFKESRDIALHPVLDELVSALGAGSLQDAYQARYLRDAIAISGDGSDFLKEINEYLEKEYFS
jgi:hypothetical protein